MAKDQMITVKLCDMVEDFDLYPRNEVSSYNIARLGEALRAGKILPPPVVERKTMRIVDGFNRKRAYANVFGPDHELQVVARSYKSDAELFKDAVQLNTEHGQPLSTQEKLKCILRLKKWGVADEEIQAAVSFTQEKIKVLIETRTAHVGGEVVELKRSMENLAGRKLTKKQNDARRDAIGHSQLYAINALLHLLNGDAIDFDNEKVVEALEQLRQVLNEKLEQIAA